MDALPVENLVTALNLYLSGALDWLPRTPGDLAETLRERPDHYGAPALIVYYYRVNVTRPPLDDPRVRQALALAIDRETLVRDVLRLGQLPALHVVPPGIPGYEPPASALGFDPERARALLAEAGYPEGRGFPEIGILYNTLEDHRKIAELVADQLRRGLGVRVVPYNQEWQSYLATTQAGDYHLSRAGWIGDYVDPNTFLDLWVTNGGNNQTGWGDPLYDRLIRAAADVETFAQEPFFDGLGEPGRLREQLTAFAAARGAERPAAGARLRLGLLREAEAILVQRAFPVIPVYFYVTSGLVAPHVGGFHAWLADGRPNLQDLHPLRGLSSLRREERSEGQPNGVAWLRSRCSWPRSRRSWGSRGSRSPPRALLGAAGLAALVFALARHPLGNAAALALAAALGALALRAPPRVLRRVAFLVPSFALLIAVTTALMYLAPGSPFAQERALAPSVEAALRERYGVPESALGFFRIYAERLVVAGDLGPALKVQGRTVGELLAPALPVSLSLGGGALLLALGDRRGSRRARGPPPGLAHRSRQHGARAARHLAPELRDRRGARDRLRARARLAPGGRLERLPLRAAHAERSRWRCPMPP